MRAVEAALIAYAYRDINAFFSSPVEKTLFSNIGFHGRQLGQTNGTSFLIGPPFTGWYKVLRSRYPHCNLSIYAIAHGSPSYLDRERLIRIRGDCAFRKVAFSNAGWADRLIWYSKGFLLVLNHYTIMRHGYSFAISQYVNTCKSNFKKDKKLIGN